VSRHETHTPVPAAAADATASASPATAATASVSLAAAATATAATLLFLSVPQAVRPAPGVAEFQRQQQLQHLLPLAPAYPTQLLADYQEAAMQFDLYKVGLNHLWQGDWLLGRRPLAAAPAGCCCYYWCGAGAAFVIVAVVMCALPFRC
jgi:hypothetical protein